MLRVPFGPLTLIGFRLDVSSTPLGWATGFLATRDMVVTPLGHDAQDFTADALLARLRSVMMPWEVEMMDTPRPLRTLGSSSLPRYWRRPERETRFRVSMTGLPS